MSQAALRNAGRNGRRRAGPGKSARPLAVRFRLTDVFNPQGALKREAAKLAARSMAAVPRRGGRNRGMDNQVLVSASTRAEFGNMPSDQVLVRLRELLQNAPEPQLEDRSGGVFDQVQEWFSDQGPQDASEAAKTWKGLARQGRRSELNAIFEHTARTMAAAEQSIQTNSRQSQPRLERAREWLEDLAWNALTLNARMSAEVITVLAERAGEAAKVVAKNAGDAFTALMGGTPRELLNDWTMAIGGLTMIGIAALFAGGYLLTTPTGMLAVSTAAKGTAGAVSSGAKLAKLVL